MNKTQIRPYSGSDVRILPPGQRQHGGMVAGAGDYYPDADRRAIVRMDQPQAPRRPPALVGEILPPMDASRGQARLPVQTVQTVTTSHTDRARGFTITSIPLALAVGFVAFLAAIGLAGVPWMSWSALLILFGVFAAVWAGAYFWHTLASPDGATILSIVLSYRYVRHEQRARLDRLAAWESDDDEDL